jgi:hypothetical protein
MWRLFGELLLDNSKFPNIANISNSSNRHGGVRGERQFPPGGKGGTAKKLFEFFIP